MATIASVLDAWINNKPAKMTSKQWNTYYRGDFYTTSYKTLHTDGTDLWSYGLRIGISERTSDGRDQKLVLDHRVNEKMTVTTQRHIRRALEIAPVHPNYKS